MEYFIFYFLNSPRDFSEVVTPVTFRRRDIFPERNWDHFIGESGKNGN